MNVYIETKITGDNCGNQSWKVKLDQDELTQIVRTQGIKAGNKALEGFVGRYVTQFKDKLSSVINK